MGRNTRRNLELNQHWDRLRQHGCIITRRPAPTIHHCHGGSMLKVPGFINPGMGQKSNDWLVIPLDMEFHTGANGIDTGQGRFKSVTEWEEAFGYQAHYLDLICELFGVNVWHRAGILRF